MGIELSRGLAAFMVLLTHYAAFIPKAPSGFGFLWTGVDLFFVISGFVFAPMILDGGQGLRDTRAFFMRRFFRIYPLYVLAVLAYYASVPAADGKPAILLRHLFFLHTTQSYAEAFYFNPAFWSLPVEMEFYLALPLLALLRGRRPALLAVFMASLLFMLVSRYLRGAEDFWRILSVHLPAILPEFLVGTLLYARVQVGQVLGIEWNSHRALGSLAVGIALLGACYTVKHGGFGLENSRVLDAPYNFLCAVGYALVMYPLLLIRNERYGLAMAQTALMAGACSYGVYLFHNLTPRLLQQAGMAAGTPAFFATAVLLTFIAAWLLYRFYENPLRKLGRRLGGRVSGQAPAPAGKLPGAAG